MKQIIMDVLNDMSHSQVNLGSNAARKIVSNLISSALKSKGCYTEYDNSETDGHDHGKVWPGTDAIQKQIYNEMTSDGLPEGGDAQAVLESHKLADEIVDNQEGKWIYESPDGGKTVFRRPFSDYDPKNKEEIDWKTGELTGRKFTEYNNGNWSNEDEG